LAIALALFVGVSFRAAGKIFIHLNLHLHLNIGTPTHTTVLNWTKKHGNVQKLLKNKGFNNESAKEAVLIFSKLNSANSLKVKKQLEEYFVNLSSKANGKTICCSSDIIESCFGKFKSIVRGNKSVGISDLALCIAAMLGQNNADRTKKSMETVSIKKMREWSAKNISKTLFAEKNDINKKIERNYLYEK
jgi:hypothetical protein